MPLHVSQHEPQHMPPKQLTPQQLHELLARELAPDSDTCAGLEPVRFQWQRHPPRGLQQLLRAVPPVQQEQQHVPKPQGQQQQRQHSEPEPQPHLQPEPQKPRQPQAQPNTPTAALRGQHGEAPGQQQQQQHLDSAQPSKQPMARKRGRPRLPEPEDLGSIADPGLISVILKRRRNRENQAASRWGMLPPGVHLPSVYDL